MLETTDGGFTKTADAGLVVDKVAVATVTSGDRCAKEVPGAGPCCDGHPLYDDCFQVCDWLLMCDEGYVPELRMLLSPSTRDGLQI